MEHCLTGRTMLRDFHSFLFHFGWYKLKETDVLELSYE